MTKALRRERIDRASGGGRGAARTRWEPRQVRRPVAVDLRGAVQRVAVWRPDPAGALGQAVAARSERQREDNRIGGPLEATDALAEQSEARTRVLAEAARTLDRDARRLLDDSRQLADDVERTCSQAAAADAEATGAVIAVVTHPHAILAVGDHAFDPGSAVDLPGDPHDLTRAGQHWIRLAARNDALAASAELMLREHRKVAEQEHHAQQKAADAARAHDAAERAAQHRDRRAADAAQQATQTAESITAWANANRELTEDDQTDPLDADTIREALAAGPAALADAADDWAQHATQRAASIAAGRDADAARHDQQAAQLAPSRSRRCPGRGTTRRQDTPPTAPILVRRGRGAGVLQRSPMARRLECESWPLVSRGSPHHPQRRDPASTLLPGRGARGSDRAGSRWAAGGVGSTLVMRCSGRRTPGRDGPVRRLAQARRGPV